MAISIPAVQEVVRSEAERELSALLGGRLTMDRVRIAPFNEVIIYDATLCDPHGEQVASLGKVGAGIDIFRLILDRKIEVTYAELIDLDARLWQQSPDAPLNIQFLIDAFKPKQPNRPPARFDLKIRNIVMRRAQFRYDKRWLPAPADSSRIDFNHLYVHNINGDIALPRLSNDDIRIDLRRLTFECGGLQLKNLSFDADITPRSIALQNINIQLPGSDISPDNISLSFRNFKDIPRVVREDMLRFAVADAKVTPSDLSALLPALSHLRSAMTLSVDVVGNANNLTLNRLHIAPYSADAADGYDLALSGHLSHLSTPRDLQVSNVRLDLQSTPGFAAQVIGFVSALTPVPAKVTDIVDALQNFRLTLRGDANIAAATVTADGRLTSSAVGDLTFDGHASGLRRGASPALDVTASSTGLNIGTLLSVPQAGRVAFEADANLQFADRYPQGEVSLSMPFAEYAGMHITNINVDASNRGNTLTAMVDVHDPAMAMSLNGEAVIADEASQWRVSGDLRDINPSLFSNMGALNGYEFSGSLDMYAVGNSLNNIEGGAELSNIKVINHNRGTDYHLDNLRISSQMRPDGLRNQSITADWLNIDLTGHYLPTDIVPAVQQMLHAALPSIIKAPAVSPERVTADISIRLAEDNPLTDWLHLPVRLLTDLDCRGYIDSGNGILNLGMQLPYLVQGRNKLIRDTYVRGNIDVARQLAAVNVSGIWPVKNGDLLLGVDLTARRDNILLSADFNKGRTEGFSGAMQVGARLHPATEHTPFSIDAHIFPGLFKINGADWLLQQSDITYAQNRVEVDNFSLFNGGQYLQIDGTLSDSADDTLRVGLSDLDLAWLFDTLNINFVTFGGRATGQIEASKLFSSAPQAETKGLYVKNFSYNGAVLGDGDLQSHWDNDHKMVAIQAEVSERGEHRLSVDGGIYVTRDSLSFDFKPERVNVAFLQPFLQGFCPDIQGRASGWVKLFGTFRDINLAGRVKADSVAMKVGFTNVTYHASDSVILDPGMIRIPEMTLRDKYGHTAKFSGQLKHNYFRDAYFNFNVRDAHRLLCLDIDAKTNPQWYGTIFGNGSVDINGRPGAVDIIADMETQDNSKFTFVLGNQFAADDYNFLSFTDTRKAAAERAKPVDTQLEKLKEFQKRVQDAVAIPTDVTLDIRAKVTDKSRLELIMDPNTGDRIIGNGNGNVNLVYTSESNDVRMYGKYIVDKGQYNFSLQDIILKDFNIKPGSNIAFDGNPMDAELDIRAAYRVNTNLTDLDKSFATDRELNRTGVPVDAMLLVTGPITRPNINFDIELPTLTAETARKVRSIISTDDMMSRQVIYLLALNRFYTPEYMGVESTGGEWASVASSTLSSQLSNMMGQLTDKVNILPSLRSDKGDFSDLEVDLALSSRLLNNRLIVNGNFGYRDKNTSNTTFIGDFDLEYLLNRRGNIRLKAYNHFNDQNYYLKSSLTTQGLGIMYRTEFDNPFRRRKPLLPAPATDSPVAPEDTITE